MWICEDVIERTSDKLEGQLSLRERVALQVHLATCLHCRRYMRQFARTVGLLREMPADATEDEVEAKAMELFRKLRGKPEA
jgi:anti-sigma factor RsiW